MTEHQLYEQIAAYLQVQYPGVVYRFDLAADLKLTPGQARKHKKLHPYRGYPDFFLAKPKRRDISVMIDFTAVDMNGKKFKPEIVVANGLFLELKKDGETLHPGPRAKKRFLSLDGKEYKNEHLREQADVLFKLREEGYAAEFSIGFDETIKKIDEYLGGE